jgi:hypothetical protein
MSPNGMIQGTMALPRRRQVGSFLPFLTCAYAIVGCSSSDPPSTVNTPEGQAGATGSTATSTAGSGGTTPAPVAGAPGGSASEAMNPYIPVVSTAGMGGEGSNPLAGVVTDEFVTDVNVMVHPEVNTLLVVTWNQLREAERVWLEFGFEEGTVMTSRAGAGGLGAHRDVVIGVPGDTDVTVRIVNEVAGTRYLTNAHAGHTDPVPGGMPEAQVEFNAELASPDRWLFGSVEDSIGGGTQNYLTETFWLYIMDRQGRIVWYFAEPASNATSSFQRIARDGEYIWIERRCFSCGGGFSESVLKMTLDWEYYEEIPVDGLADCIDVTEDGSLLYDRGGTLTERTAAGQTRSIWSCAETYGQTFNCYTNTINYSPTTKTVFMSFPEPGMVVEIDRASGELVAQFGNQPGSWAFAPPLQTPPVAWRFGFQHFPNLSPEGTLMLSSHMPGFEAFTQTPTPNQHAFLEFEIDRANQRLIERWRYTEGPEWARSKGMAIRLPNGNILANYGTGGVIREITPNKQTAFRVKFDVPDGDDFFNKMVGNNVLINDLYALNGGPKAAP